MKLMTDLCWECQRNSAAFFVLLISQFQKSLLPSRQLKSISGLCRWRDHFTNQSQTNVDKRSKIISHITGLSHHHHQNPKLLPTHLRLKPTTLSILHEQFISHQIRCSPGQSIFSLHENVRYLAYIMKPCLVKSIF